MKKSTVLVGVITLFFCFLEATPRRQLRTSRQRSIQKAPRKKKPVHTTPTQQHSSTTPNKQSLLTHALHKVVQQADKKAAIGVKVVSLKDNRILFQKNIHRVFTPASNTKLITAGAAFHILGSDYRFETQLLTDSSIAHHKINNLYIKGSGDPTLITKDLEKLVKTLKGRSIKEIRGDLIIDSSIFDQESTAPGWGKGDGPIFHKSPVGGLMANHSCITIRIKPAGIGRKPIVYKDPTYPLMHLENRARTTVHAKKHSLQVTRSKDNRLIITGTIAKNRREKLFRIAVNQPHFHAGHILRSLLRKHRIVLKGKVRNGRIKQGLTVLTRHHSQPTKQIIRHMMKHSDNLYADALFKKMGATIYGTPGTWAKGKKAVKSFLVNQVGLAAQDLKLNDGSGLSHANKISPDHLAQFLAWIYNQASFKGPFIESLPLSGTDGTLRHRMKHKTVHKKVRAKTGSLFGVSSLSGYITTQKNPDLLFVIMVNRKNKSAVEFKKQLEDHLCKLLAAHAFSTS